MIEWVGKFRQKGSDKMKVRISICDDERELRHALKQTVEIEMQLKGVGYEIEECSSGEELLRNCHDRKPDVLFLDIEMGRMNGMETARELRKMCKDTVIIFVTAYADYVFQGYDVHAFHYILKPYKEEKVKEVLATALAEADSLESRYYVIEQKSGTMRLCLNDVIYFQSDRKKIRAVLRSGEEEFYGRLSDVAAELPGYFARSHNRYLVNLNYVTKLESAMCICAEEEIPISRGYRQELSVAFAKLMLSSAGAGG